MIDIRVGDVVRLKIEQEIDFVVTEDLGKTEDRSLDKMFRIVSFNKKNNNKLIELVVHQAALEYVR